MLRVYRVLIALGIVAMLAGCEPPNPDANTPTSGRLILFVDEMYAPLVEALRDTFVLRSPNAHVEIHAVPARVAIEEMLRADAGMAQRRDTTATVAAVIGRRMLPDEESAAAETGDQLGTYVIGYDGLVAAVASGSPMRQTTVERLRNALKSPPGYPLTIDTPASGGTTQFLVPNQNSSTFMVVRTGLLGDSNIAAPVRYFATSDSVVERAAAGDGIALLGWYRVNRDSARLRPLLMGHNDTLGRFISPVRVHPSTLVTGTYPLRQPIVGYTLAPVNSLANGFLTWLARSQDAQYFLVYRGLQPENVKIELVVPDDGTD